MKNLSDYEEDIQKCSRCGLCQEVCPVYRVKKTECVISRGKFSMLSGLLKKELVLDRAMLKNFDLCLSCNACKDFCPSQINPVEIFEALKYEYKLQNPRHITERLLFSSEFMKLGLKLSSLFSKILIRPKCSPKKINGNNNNNLKIAYFEGCVNKYINPSAKNATVNLLQGLGFDCEILDFDCCGVMFKADGDFESFKKLEKKNIELVQNGFDYLIFDCESCMHTFSQYKIEDNHLKLMSVTDFLESAGYKPKSNKPVKITYHKPCHQTKVPELIKNIENVEYVESKDYDVCCGFSGTFALKHPGISQKISSEKAENLLNTEADVIITTCPSCVLGIKQGLFRNGQKKTVLSLVEFLDEYSL